MASDIITTIQGNIFEDKRGAIHFVNDFHFEGIKRTYVIYHTDTNIIRGWHGHRFERKWFYCLKGSFTLKLIKIDNWKAPSANLLPETFELSGKKSEIICVPSGYANWVKANEPDSILAVYSDKTIEEAQGDSWRYDEKLWLNNK